MKILILISGDEYDPDMTGANQDNQYPHAGSLSEKINPADEHVIGLADRLVNEGPAEHVSFLYLGPYASGEKVLRKALAICGESGTIIDIPTHDLQYCAQHASSYCKDGGFDLVLCGGVTDRPGTALICAMVSFYLQWPFIAQVTDMRVYDGVLNARFARQLYLLKREISKPAIITCSDEVSEKKVPSMKDIIAARQKPITHIKPEAAKAATSVVGFKSGIKRNKTIFFSAGELSAAAKTIVHLSKTPY